MKFHFVLILFLSSAFGAVYQIENLLDCEDMNEFPSGSYEEVEILDCSRNNFIELTPNIFADSKFFNLKEATLRSNNITNIRPDSFALMSIISYLDLYGNKLTVLQKNSFKGLDTLKILLVVYNEIQIIEGGALEALPQLEKLDLSHNKITRLNKTLLKHTNVSELNLSNNPIVFPEQGAILESSSLKHLSLEDCNLTILQKNSFSKLQNLEYLSLSWNKLRVLPEDLLKPLENLEVFDISHNFIVTMDFYWSPRLDTVYCIGNPLEDTINCRNNLEKTQLPSVGFDENQDQSFKRNKIEDSNTITDFSLDEETVEASKNDNKSNETVVQTKQSPVKPRKEDSYREAQTLLMFVILGALVVCAVFLLTLIAQVYCLVAIDRADSRVCCIDMA